MSDMGSHNFPSARPLPVVENETQGDADHGAASRRSEGLKIGEVIDIAGSSSKVIMETAILSGLLDHHDATVQMAGQVGSQVKIRVGQTWLLANIRTQRRYEGQPGLVVAEIDFLGEGDEEKLTGQIYNFRRGVTRYPTPDSVVYAVTTADLKQVYASDGRANVEVGTVYPTTDIRGAL